MGNRAPWQCLGLGVRRGAGGSGQELGGSEQELGGLWQSWGVRVRIGRVIAVLGALHCTGDFRAVHGGNAVRGGGKEEGFAVHRDPRTAWG